MKHVLFFSWMWIWEYFTWIFFCTKVCFEYFEWSKLKYLLYYLKLVGFYVKTYFLVKLHWKKFQKLRFYFLNNIFVFTLKGRIIPNLYGLIHLKMYHVDKFIFEKKYISDNFDSLYSQLKYMLKIQIIFKNHFFLI